MLPDAIDEMPLGNDIESQCTYRCVVLPDRAACAILGVAPVCLNAPTGAWCSLTDGALGRQVGDAGSQCTYRCVVLPDLSRLFDSETSLSLNAPTGAWCSLTRTLPGLQQGPPGVSMHLQVRGAP